MSGADSERARDRVGLVLRGKWRLDALLGVGGMAAVYAATHRNGKRGAVKLLHRDLSGDPQVRERFLREGYVANRVAHPATVSVLDDDVADDGSVFLVMELLEGETVDARAERHGGKLDLREALSIAAQLLDALAAAHDAGIVHRDLKPENLFLLGDGTLKVLDFGIARILDGSPRATVMNVAMGTPAFMPPEQAMGEWDQVDARTDLWAVGATLFSLITGRFVHDADTIQKMMLAAMTRPAPPLASVVRDCPPPVCFLVDRALARQQRDRWPDARSMAEATRACLDSLGGDPAVDPGVRTLVSASASLQSSPGAHTALALAGDSQPGTGGRGRVVGVSVLALCSVVAAGVWWASRAPTLGHGGDAAPASPAVVDTAPSSSPPATSDSAPALVEPAVAPPPSASAPAADPATPPKPRATPRPSARSPEARPSATPAPPPRSFDGRF